LHFYEKELNSLKRVGRLRSRVVHPKTLIDMASNDYLGLAYNQTLLEKAYKRLSNYNSHSPKASMLVNGYHPLHKEFEEYISKRTGFEDTIVVGSGFLANISLIDALVRKGDLLVLDEEFHASGIMASKLVKNIIFFKHNDPNDLENILNKKTYKRVIVGVEGVYSMSGNILNRDIINICDKHQAIMIIDEAHSSGVLGDKFLGIYDHYNITPKSNHIKMATLGKAIGSYGAYISASSHIIEYLLNRGKPIIYSTAPSLFDITLAHESYLYIEEHKKILKQKRDTHIKSVKDILNKEINSLIMTLDIADNKKVIKLQKDIKEIGFLVGAIREPTVKSAILRVILRTSIDEKRVKELLFYLKEQLFLSSF